MRASLFALAIAALTFSAARAHGPQMQITSESNKLVTRQLILDGPYSDSLTAPKSVYVIPFLPYNSVWYGRPNSAIDPIFGTPLYLSGPGLAYGYDRADGGPQTFTAGSVFSVSFTSGLKKWDGASFTDAGTAQLKAYRGSNVSISSPAENFAITSDAASFDSLSLSAVATDYGSAINGHEVHGGISYVLLADGTTPTSSDTVASDGVYLAGFQVSSTQAGLNPSDEYFFLLHKNASLTMVADAASSLGFSASQVQWLGVPEPGSLVTMAMGMGILFSNYFAGRRRQRG